MRNEYAKIATDKCQGIIIAKTTLEPLKKTL
jgi:hypothetical protein